MWITPPNSNSKENVMVCDVSMLDALDAKDEMRMTNPQG